MDLGPHSDWDRENEEYDFLDRKVEIRIDDYDTFAVDHTLSLIIVPISRQLKEARHGSPGIEEADIPDVHSIKNHCENIGHKFKKA